MTRARDLARFGSQTAMTFTSNNDVGIGTTNPATKFEVDGTITADNIDAGSIGFSSASTLLVTGIATFNGITSFTSDVSIAGTLTYEDVTNIDSVGLITARSGIVVSGGNIVLTGIGSVGINSAAPTNALDVKGSIVSGGDAALSTRPAGIAIQETGVIVAARSNASVFVGFNEGTDTATSIISSTGDATFRGITIGTGATIFSPSSNELTLGTNNIERVRIVSSGSVGIGTNEPVTTLEVFDPTPRDVDYYNSPLSIGNSGTNTNGGHMLGEGPALNFRLTRSSDGSEASTAYIRAIAEGDLGSSWPTSMSFGLRRFGSSAVELMRLTSTGNLGINTTSPRSKLEINGNLTFTTAGQGINFNNYGSGTNISSNLLDDYEEGTFTMSVASTGNLGGSMASTTGKYTKIGRLVRVSAKLLANNVQTAGHSGTVILKGFPF